MESASTPNSGQGRHTAARTPDGAPLAVLQAHARLRLDELRRYRSALQDEQRQVAYWRAVLNARLEAVRSGGAPATLGGSRTVDASTLRRALHADRVNAGRSALRQVVAGDDLPPLPDLAELWARTLDAGDQPGRAQLEADLLTARAQVSDYRGAVLRRHEHATQALIARLRTHPALGLSALPLPPRRPPRGGATSL